MQMRNGGQNDDEFTLALLGVASLAYFAFKVGKLKKVVIRFEYNC